MHPRLERRGDGGTQIDTVLGLAFRRGAIAQHDCANRGWPRCLGWVMLLPVTLRKVHLRAGDQHAADRDERDRSGTPVSHVPEVIRSAQSFAQESKSSDAVGRRHIPTVNEY